MEKPSFKNGGIILPTIQRKKGSSQGISQSLYLNSSSAHSLSQSKQSRYDLSPDHSRQTQSDQNLSYAYRLSLKSKSPSCKKIFGQTLSKKKMPISNLSVTKYKELLAQENNDPKQPDISLHIPIDNEETKNLILSLSQITLNNQQNQLQNSQKGRKQLGALLQKEEEKSIFLPFKNGKEINRHEFIRLHQENPSFQNLDFHELYQLSNSQVQMMGRVGGGWGQDKDKNIDYKDDISSGSEDEQGGRLFHLSNSYGKRQSQKMNRNLSGKMTSSTQRSLKPLNKIELSLIHNKDILCNLTSNLLSESRSQYDLISRQITDQEDIIKNMPKIKQYPIFKKKLIATEQANSNEGKSEENTGKAVNSPRDNEAELHATKSGEDDSKKVRFQGTAIVDGKYQVYWYSFEQYSWKPDIRVSQVLVMDGKKAYIFGGVGHEIYNGMYELDLETFKWVVLKNEAEPNCPVARFGHSGNLYRKSLVFFGGEYHTMQNNIKFKDCLMEIYFYNLETNTWKFINCGGGPLQPRKNHASAILGRNLIIHGGLNSKDTILRDMWTLDLGTNSWSEVQVNGEYDLCFHCCTPVYYSQRQGKINLYKLGEIKITKWGANIQQEGLYFFGGKNSKGEAVGDLKILKTDCKPMQWIRPDTKGTQPKPRYGHSIDFSPELNFLIIHGGKNDSDSDVYFGDTHILNVDDFTWVKVILHGKCSPPRSNHSSCLFETKLIIFGGINLDGFLPPSVSVLELDNVLARKLQEREENFSGAKLPSLLPNELKKPIEAQQRLLLQSQGSQAQQPKKIIKNASGENNIRLDHIPFSEQVHQMSNQDDNSAIINSLNYQNFKSFLPIPRFAQSSYQRAAKQKSTFLKQPVLYNPQTNQAIPIQSKSVVYE